MIPRPLMGAFPATRHAAAIVAGLSCRAARTVLRVRAEKAITTPTYQVRVENVNGSVKKASCPAHGTAAEAAG